MKRQFEIDGINLSSLFDLSSSPVEFSDDCRKHIPSTGSIIYTVWDKSDQFIYVGISGLQNKPSSERNPISRMVSHSSGRRSGDQFCVYVHDFYVIPNLILEGDFEPERRLLDKLTKEYIHKNLTYRFLSIQSEDGVKIVRDLENKIKQGVFGFPPPYLNGV
jgi:hypothetical protein